MADKEVTIKVTAEVDIDNLQDLNDILSNLKTNSEEAGEILKTSLEEATNEVETLTEELAKIELGESDADFDTISEQLSEATDRATELEQELNNLQTTNLDSANDSANELSDGLGNATSSANDLADSMGLIESSVLMDMAGQIGALGDQAEGMAQEMNTASISIGQLATNVGIAEPQMVNMINYISNATFPQNEAIAYANALNQMGVSAEQLGDSATNMDKINDATGIGYQKVMQLTQGLQAVGVSANQLPSSFNAIAFAQSNVNGGADTLTTVLKRQASTINEYGLNVDQLVIIMQKLSEQGVQGMKMGSELSKVLKDNNGDLSAVEKQLGLTSGALSNASQITGEYEGKLQKLADEEAEHKTFIDQLNAGWEDMQLVLAPVLTPLASFIGLIGGIGQTALAINSILTLAETFGILKTATIAQTVSNWALAISEWAVASPILIVIGVILVLIGALVYLYFNNEQVRQTVDALGQALIWLGEIIYNSVVGAVQWLISVFQDFTAQMGLNTNNWIEAVLGFIIFMPQLPLRVGQLLLDTIAKALGFGDNFSQTMINSATNSVNGFISYISQLPSMFWGELSKMLDMAQNFAMQIADILTMGGASMVMGWITGSGESSPGFMYDALVGELTAMANAPSEFLMGLVTSIADFGGQMAEALTLALFGVSFEGLQNNILLLWSSLNGLWNYILGFSNNVTNTVSILNAYVMNAVNILLSYISMLPTTLSGILNNLISRVISFAGGFANNLMNAGRNAVNQFTSAIRGLPDGFRSEINQIIADATSFVGNIGSILYNAGVNAIQNFLSGLDRHSPGKMQREFRAEITEMGEAVPVDSKNLIRNVGRLGSDIVNSFDTPNLRFDMTGTSQLIEGVYDNTSPLQPIINIEVGTVDNEDRIQEILDAVKRELYWNNATAGRTVQ